MSLFSENIIYLISEQDYHRIKIEEAIGFASQCFQENMTWSEVYDYVAQLDENYNLSKKEINYVIEKVYNSLIE